LLLNLNRFSIMTGNLAVSIERGTEADVDWCTHLMASTEPWLTLRPSPKACEAVFRRPGCELLLARQGETKLGFILLQSSGLAGSPYVGAIAVASEARGKSVGSQLLSFADKHFPAARNIFLCVSDFNAGAIALYKRVGYEQVGVLKDYVVEGHDELIMRKRLK
jgi:[ribosomal protein S18]-alanine N-acetyltransferase